MLSVRSIKSWVMSKINPYSHKIDLGAMRISPVDAPPRLKEQFIPLARTTLIRKLSQDPSFVTRANEAQFEFLCRYMDACIQNRHSLLWQQLRGGYEHINPDVELIIDGRTFSSFRNQILDDEFSFVQKLGRLLKLANFMEMSKDHLEKWLQQEGGPGVVNTWVEPGHYELLKVWMLGRDKRADKAGGVGAFVAKYWPLQSRLSPFRHGDVFRRVVIAVRTKKSDKVELKVFKNLSEGELIHILPEVNISHSKFDNTALLWTSSLFAVGALTHLMLPAASIESGWLLTSSVQLANLLAGLSAVVALLQWNVIQQKKCHYWRWRAQLNSQSVMANNRGVLALLAERAQEEIFKEAVLAYMSMLRHPSGVSQSQLEAEVDLWAVANSDKKLQDEDLKTDLTESLSLLRQLHLVTLDVSTNIVSAVSLQSAVALLGSEFQANNIVDTDGTVVSAAPSEDVTVGAPPAESYEKLRGRVEERAP